MTSALGARAAGTDASAADGFVGKGAMVVQTALGASSDKLTVGGNVAFEARGPLVRVDLMSLGIPGADAIVGTALANQLIPPGGVVGVYDRSQSTFTVWSPFKQMYYTGGAVKPSPMPSATASTPANFPDPFGLAKALKDLRAFSFSVNLAGHGTTNGHPTTGLDYALLRQDKDGNPLDIHGRIEVADDLGIPVQFTSSYKGKGIDAAARIDVTEFEKRLPPQGDFAVPKGYTRAHDLGEVLGRSLPLPN